MQPNQQVTLLTDGGEDVRDLPLYLNPQSEQYLDWFHVTMRITVMTQMAKALRSRDNPDPATEVADELERLKWFLWHGNVFGALQVVEDLEIDLDVEHASAEQRKLLKTVTEFGGYIRANASCIPNYGEKYRNGETISSAFVESTVNQVVSKRMVSSSECGGRLRALTCSCRSAPARSTASWQRPSARGTRPLRWTTTPSPRGAISSCVVPDLKRSRIEGRCLLAV